MTSVELVCIFVAFRFIHRVILHLKHEIPTARRPYPSGDVNRSRGITGDRVECSPSYPGLGVDVAKGTELLEVFKPHESTSTITVRMNKGDLVCEGERKGQAFRNLPRCSPSTPLNMYWGFVENNRWVSSCGPPESSTVYSVFLLDFISFEQTKTHSHPSCNRAVRVAYPFGFI